MLLAKFDRKSPTTRDAPGDTVILADARIDDRQALLAKLRITQPIADEGLVLEAYARWGEKCVDHLIGDFAFVIVDARRKQIFCARDYIGARPLFYSLDHDELHIASDIAGLANDRSREFDHRVVASVLAFNTYFPTDRTLLKHVKRLPPGHTLTVRADSHTLERYWEPRNFSLLKLPSDDDYIESGRELLAQAVSDRLRDTARPSVHLSGGLDSSAVAALVTNSQREAGRSDPLAYAWYLGDTDNPADDETRWAEATRSALDVVMHAPTAKVDGLTAILRADWCLAPDASNLFGETAILDHARSHGVDTILSGWGGDEGLSFNGRGYRAELLLSLRWRELASICQGPFPASLARGIKQGLGELAQSKTGEQAKAEICTSYLRPEIVADVELFTPAPISLHSSRQAMASLLETGAQTARLEDWAIAGRSHGITYSYPLLDRRVIEFALSLPGHLFYRPEARRWIMRKVLDPKLPDLARWNDSKLELARVNHLKALMAEAFEQCADLLEGCSDFEGREQFVDVDRLIDDLRGPKENLLDNFSNKRRALQFLKF